MLPRVLFVDDDKLLLSSMTRAFRGRYEMVTAASGPEALEVTRQNSPFAVVVADMGMPGMSGTEFLQAFADVSADTVRVMLTGQADLATAVEAVNLGQVFRFLTKPCETRSLEAVIDAGISQYRLATSDRILMEKTLAGSVETLVALLSESDPRTYRFAETVREYAMKLGAAMELPTPWDLGLAALLAQIGKLSIPMEVHNKAARGERLTLQESELYLKVPEYSARMVAHIPRLGSVARIIQYATKDFDGGGYPYDGVRGADLPLESRILKVVTVFLTQFQIRKSRPVVVAQMKLDRGKYDSAVLAALEAVVNESPYPTGEHSARLMDVAELRPGMVLAADIPSDKGVLVLSAGTRLSAFHLDKLRGLQNARALGDQVLVNPYDAMV